MRSRRGNSRPRPRLGATMTIPLSRSSGPGAPMPTPMKSRRAASVCAIVSRMTPSIMPTMRSATASAPSSALVGIARIPMMMDVRHRRSRARHDAFVPPRSTPTMYRRRSLGAGMFWLEMDWEEKGRLPLGSGQDKQTASDHRHNGCPAIPARAHAAPVTERTAAWSVSGVAGPAGVAGVIRDARPPARTWGASGPEAKLRVNRSGRRWRPWAYPWRTRGGAAPNRW